MERESRTLEYKESLTSKTYLKTVSAFANYGTGRIVFGVTDDYQVVGLADPVQACLNLENQLNDAMQPVPRYQLQINDANQTVTLTVFKGEQTPYCYKKRAFKRNDSASVEVSAYEFQQLILTGQHLNFEDLPADDQALTFEALTADMTQRLALQHVNRDILKTLDLLTADGKYNNAAAILADQNKFAGIDLARFGQTNSTILDRQRYVGVSILKQLTAAMTMYRQYYQYETVTGAYRETVEQIPELAFREALANSLVHRAWNLPNNVQIGMYPDRIELVSPGSLPANLSPAEYLQGQVSVLRNPKLAGVLFRLRYIEQFGTGIQKVLAVYEATNAKPQFQFSENLIRVTLPVIKATLQPTTKGLTADEERLLEQMQSYRSYTRNQLDIATGFDKNKTVRLLRYLQAKGLVRKVGQGRSTRYQLN